MNSDSIIYFLSFLWLFLLAFFPKEIYTNFLSIGAFQSILIWIREYENRSYCHCRYNQLVLQHKEDGWAEQESAEEESAEEEWTNEEQTTKIINLPDDCLIKIFSIFGYSNFIQCGNRQ